MTPELQHRLLLAKDLSRRATWTLAEDSMFSNGIAVSHFHDAVEVVAVGAALSLSLSPGKEFIKTWDNVSAQAAPAPRDCLPFRTEMLALNNARVGFKHYGQIIDRREATRHASNVSRFLSETCRNFFAVDFDALSEVDLIENPTAKALLKAAEGRIAGGELQEAIQNCIDARELLLEQVGRLLVPKPVLGSHSAGAATDLKGLVEQIFTAMNGLGEAIIANMCGIDYFEYRAMFAFFPIKTGRHYVSRPGYDRLNTPERVSRCIEVLARFFIQAAEHLPPIPQIPARSPTVHP